MGGGIGGVDLLGYGVFFYVWAGLGRRRTSRFGGETFIINHLE